MRLIIFSSASKAMFYQGWLRFRLFLLVLTTVYLPRYLGQAPVRPQWQNKPREVITISFKVYQQQYGVGRVEGF